MAAASEFPSLQSSGSFCHERPTYRQACRWHPFRGDTKEYQRAVGAEQLHSPGKEKCKVNNTVSWQYINQQNNPQRRNRSLMSDGVAGEGERQGDEKAYSVIQPSPADRSRHYVRNRA